MPPLDQAGALLSSPIAAGYGSVTNHRGELKQQAVASGLNNSSAVRRHQRISNSTMFPQNASGADFIDAHKPRIAGDIGGQYRRQSAFDPTWLLLHHGARKPLRAIVVL
jgi:hypothetical protein